MHKSLQNILIHLHGYRTPDKVVELLTEPRQISTNNAIIGNPPFKNK